VSTGLEVLAVAARTPVGLRAETSAAAVRAGISRSREFPYVTLQGEPMIVAADPRLHDALEGRARLEPIMASVVAEIREGLGAVDLSRGGCDVMLALPELRPGFSEDDAQWACTTVKRLLYAQRIDARVSVGGRGHAGAIEAVERVAALASSARPAIYVVMGVDSYVDLATFDWLESQRRFAQPSTRSGFVPGEGAGALVLATRAVRRSLRCPALARVAGVGTGYELRLRGSEAGSLGVGLADAVRKAYAGLVLPRDAADQVYCDINGERYRSEEWGFFAMRAPQAMRRPEYHAPSDCWGDVGAAFGALAGVLGVQSIVRGYARGPTTLVTAASDGGLRGALILQPPEG